MMILQSDNSILYLNSIVKFFIRVFIISTGIFVFCYIHTETESGKVVVDGNFTTMMNILCTYVGTGFNVCTPTQVACELNCNGGGYNCIMGLIKHYLIHINALIYEHNFDINHLNNMFGLTN